MEHQPIRRVYLDWNVYVGTVQGRDHHPDLARLLAEARKAGRISVPYSTAHLDECANITCATTQDTQSERAAHLAVVAELSGRTYLRFNHVGTPGMLEHALDPFTNDDHIKAQTPRLGSALDRFLTWMPDKRLPSTRCLDSRVLNNLDERAIWAYLRENWSDAMTQVAEPHWAGRAWLRMRSRLGRPPPSHDVALRNQIGHHPPLSPMYFAALISWLDMCGYYPDKRRPSRSTNRARLWDGMHTAFAGTCDLFVSGDAKLVKKARAAYSWAGCRTSVVDAEQAVGALSPR